MFNKVKRETLGYKQGFKPLPDEEKRNQTILIKLSGDEKQFLDYYCKKNKIQKSNLIRGLLYEKLSQENRFINL